MKKIIICAVLIAVAVTVIFTWPSKTFPGCCVVDENDFDLNMVNEVFKLDFGPDVTIVDHSFLPVVPHPGYDGPSETEFNVILEFPSDKNDAYYEMINKQYALMTSEEQITESPIIFENIFSNRSIALDSMFRRFDTIITNERFLFSGTRTRDPIVTLVGIENGESSTTVYLHAIGHNEGDKLVFSGKQS